MGKLSDLPPLLAKQFGQPESMMLQYCRRIREAGHVTTGPRGPGGLTLNNGDVARILIGILGLQNAKKASKDMDDLLNLQYINAAPDDTKHDEDIDELLSYFEPVRNLEKSVTNLLAMFQSRRAMIAWHKLEIPKATLSIDQVSLTARIKLVSDIQSINVEMASTLFTEKISRSSKPKTAPTVAPDLKITKTVSDLTFEALANFVNDGDST